MNKSSINKINVRNVTYAYVFHKQDTKIILEKKTLYTELLKRALIRISLLFLNKMQKTTAK